uniref:Uncharacterized protein n=1 Tax=Arundo donax TaxID=35708 RepID=A0A0A8ZZ76_ARUDO
MGIIFFPNVLKVRLFKSDTSADINISSKHCT